MGKTHVQSTLVLWMVIGALVCEADKLSSGQKAPSHANNSGGAGLKAPFRGSRGAADVAFRQDVGRSGGIPSPPRQSPPPSPPKEDGVIREETEDIKEVDGKPVRVVKGRLAYDSPEGLPVAIKYEADENGNRASFTIGTPGKGGGSSGGSGGSSKTGGSNVGKRPGGSSGGGGGGGRGGGGGGSGGNGDTTYLPPTKVDKSYLPPS